MNSKKTVVIATGGTGGHIFPSLSLADFLCKEYEIEIFTDERGSKFLQNDQNFKIKLGRLKTGTPPRLDGTTINYDNLEKQDADIDPEYFSFLII